MTRKIDRITELRRRDEPAAWPVIEAAADAVQSLHRALGLPVGVTLTFGTGAPYIEATDEQVADVAAVLDATWHGPVAIDRPGVKRWTLG